MPKLTALHQFTFDGRIRQKGETVEASDTDAETLVLLGHVERQSGAGLAYSTRNLSTGAEKKPKAPIRQPGPIVTKGA